MIEPATQTMDETPTWHTLTSADVAERLQVDPKQGLATDTATDVASDLIGAGTLGRAAGSYFRESERRRRRSGSLSRPVLSLPARTGIRVFFQETVAIRAER